MTPDSVATIIGVLSELTLTTFIGLVWWLERKERHVLRDLILRDWTRESDEEFEVKQRDNLNIRSKGDTARIQQKSA